MDRAIQQQQHSEHASPTDDRFLDLGTRSDADVTTNITGRRLQLCSLEQRWLHFDLFMCYRIIFGLVNVYVSDFFELHCASQTRGHPFKLYKERSCSSVCASYFSVCVINVSNSLRADRVDFSSFVAFKRSIEQIDFSQFLLGYDN